MSKEPHPAFTKNFKLGFDTGFEKGEATGVKKTRLEVGTSLGNLLSTVNEIEGVGKVMAERIQRHFGGGRNEYDGL